MGFRKYLRPFYYYYLTQLGSYVNPILCLIGRTVCHDNSSFGTVYSSKEPTYKPYTNWFRGNWFVKYVNLVFVSIICYVCLFSVKLSKILPLTPRSLDVWSVTVCITLEFIKNPKTNFLAINCPKAEPKAFQSQIYLLTNLNNF